MSLSPPSEVLLHPRIAVEGSPVARMVAVARSARDTVSLSLHDNLEAAESEWRRFEETADCTVFQSYDWHALWWKHIGAPAGSEPVIIIGREHERVLFILPLAIERGRFARTLQWHAGDLSDYNAPLLAPDFASVVDPTRFAVIFGEVRRLIARDRRFAYDAVVLTKMPDRVGGQANPFMALPTTVHPSGAYAVALTGDWEAFYAEKRSSATRRRDRTKRKRLAGMGEVRFVTPEDAAGIGANFDILVAQKTKQFAAMGVEDLFARPGFRDLFVDLATNLATRGLAHLSRLEVGPVAAATNYGLVFRGRYYHIFASYDSGPASRFGPGVAHLHELMRYAIGRQCTVFDFTIGDEGYKREWADILIALHDHRSAATFMGMLTVAPAAAIAYAKRTIKQNPTLWSWATKVRAYLASFRRKGADCPPASPAPADEAEDA
jgi:CelD/BcsL family acetyltransferase involved in cellulose biosynthesis